MLVLVDVMLLMQFLSSFISIIIALYIYIKSLTYAISGFRQMKLRW